MSGARKRVSYWDRRAGAQIIMLGLVMPLPFCLIAGVVIWVFDGGLNVGKSQGPDFGELAMAQAIMVPIALVHALITTPLMALVLFKKPLGRSITMVYLPTYCFAMFFGMFAPLTTPFIALGTTILFTFIAGGFLPDWFPRWGCQSCGYDLRGSPTGPCPECGEARGGA